MEIRTLKQYNQGVGKYKLLSSNAGVGAIIPTKSGGFVMPMSSSYWDFIKVVSDKIRENSGISIDQTLADNLGVEFIYDPRFINFLRSAENLTSLKCLVAIPHIELTGLNLCKADEHPLNKRFLEKNPQAGGLKEGMFTVPAITFPRWFFTKRPSHDLMPVEDWFRIWQERGCNDGSPEYFAPPRDPKSPTTKVHVKSRLPEGKNQVYNLLEQVAMVLICKNGHMSDIPWDKYFCAVRSLGKDIVHKEGFDLFGFDVTDYPCPSSDNGKHQLQWHENRAHSESFGTLKCGCCGQSISLEGIMNLQPLCPGHRPWEGPTARDTAPCRHNHQPVNMKWALVTSNSVYYAESFSSLYLPSCYLDPASSLNETEQKLLNLLTTRWFSRYLQRHPDKTKEDYINSTTLEDLTDKAFESDYDVTVDDMKRIVEVFLLGDDASTSSDSREEYRFTEFSVFQNNDKSNEDSDKLVFADIELPESLKPYFSKIQQVETLAVSSTQINFSRVQMPQPEIINGITKYPSSMKIFKEPNEEVLVMPANQTFGEGLFFSLNEGFISHWIENNWTTFQKRYPHNRHMESLYENVAAMMQEGGVEKFYLLHTLSHIIMKELEFSCGYPTASLKERLYFSERMCGVLIYTADGSEGSMGGLVWQGQPALIENIIKSALARALDCSSDPICWENDSDPLNYAACFSCAMVSETSCEQRNLGLDRRILVDENFGFFKNLLYHPNREYK